MKQQQKPTLRGHLDGLPVIDATEPLVIEVERRDINYRRRKDPHACAIAEACKRDLHVDDAYVYLSRVYIKNGDHWLRYVLPEPARTEAILFDRGHEFRPGSYRLGAMPPAKRSGSPAQGGTGKSRTGKGPPRAPGRELQGVRARSPLVGQPIEQVP